MRCGWLCNLLAISCLLLIPVAPTRADLNFVPQREEFSLDGVKMWHLAFETGLNDKATYRPPEGWLYSGSADQLDLQPKGRNQAQATITKIPLKESTPLDEKGRKKLAEEALKSLPSGSEHQKIESEETNALRISGNDTYLLQLTYTFYGEKFKRYSLFLNLKQFQLRFQLTCRESDYSELSKAFQASLYSWQHLPNR